jgi:hypothetical protein
MSALTVILVITNGNGSLLQNAFGDSESIVGDVIGEDNINIQDLFEMQMRMNHLSQLSDMSERVLQNSVTQEFVRGIK